MPGPTVGQHGNSGTSWHNTISGQVTVATNTSLGWIVLCIDTEIGAGVGATVSSISSTHTTNWTKIGSLTYGSTANAMEVWEGSFSSTLTSEVITVTMSQIVDCGAITWQEVGGNNLSLDTNVSLPAVASHQDLVGFTTTTPQVTGVSTNSATAAVFGFFGSRTNITLPTAGSGFTLQDAINSNAGTHQAIAASEFETISSKLSSATLGFTGSYFDWGVIFFVITNPPPPPAYFPVLSTTNVI